MRGSRPQIYGQIAAVVAVGLALAYLTLEVRTLYHGPVLTLGETSSAEQYTYSAVWLAFGVALLAAGIFLQSQAVRLASAAVIILLLRVAKEDALELLARDQDLSKAEHTALRKRLVKQFAKKAAA